MPCSGLQPGDPRRSFLWRNTDHARRDRCAGSRARLYRSARAGADETSQSLLGKFPTSPVFDHLDVPEGRIWLKQSGVKHFAGDLPEAEQKLVYAKQAAPVADIF